MRSEKEARIPLERAIEFMDAQVGELYGVSGVIFYASDILYYLQKLADMSAWIPCSEKLPETNEDVLLQFKSNQGVGYYEDGYWFVACGEDLYSGLDAEDIKPIAWMPLPARLQKRKEAQK